MWSRRLTRSCIVAIFGAALLVAGCATWKRTSPLPTSSTLRVGQLIIHCDFPLSPEHRLLSDLNQLRGRIADELGLLAGGEPVEVFLFQTAQSYQAFLKTHHPDLPDRRALFVETDTHLSVYATWGDRVAEDLRHEVSHGYMHSMLPELPLWIDEGLAESFEVRADQRGLNVPHLENLVEEHRRGAWRPNLTRLAAIRSIEQMHQSEYQEAWAWMYWLLNSRPENKVLVQTYLAALREGRRPPPLEETVAREIPNAGEQLVKFLEELAANKPSHSEASARF